MRRLTTEFEHDRLIETVASHYRQQGLLVFTNPGQTKNYPVDGDYPDILCRFPSMALARIAEIETVETVSPDHAPQWRNYGAIAARYGVPFDLWVPASCVAQARQLLVAMGVNAHVRTW